MIDEKATDAVMRMARGALALQPQRPVIIGICGAQGSGKTTLTGKLLMRCESEGICAASLSLDDLYLTRSEREELARSVHPLFAVRGVPGTHDIALGMEIFDLLGAGESVAMPRFDKAQDDRCDAASWNYAPAACQLLFFEGWCVGAMPQSGDDLREPVNALEAGEDEQAIWRRFANAALAGPYRALFDRLDRLILLAAPGFDVVHQWRAQQESELREQVGNDAPGLMDDAAITRFIAHYERLTRYILAEMPGRADCIIWLDEKRRAMNIDMKN